MKRLVRGGPVQWIGGKAVNGRRIISSIPRNVKRYVECYGGGGAILFSRTPCSEEVYNDKCVQLVDTMQVLQDETLYRLLMRRLRYTLYARAEYALATELFNRRQKPRDVVESAWASIVGLRQGFGGKPPSCVGSWGRALESMCDEAPVTSRWRSAVASMSFFHHRLRNVTITREDAIRSLHRWDSPETAFYLDPPYIRDTRVSKNVYLHEASNKHHRQLVKSILAVRGAVVLSGYNANHRIYRPLLDAGWHVRTFEAGCQVQGRTRQSGIRGGSAGTRTEVVFSNPRALELTGYIR